MNININNGITVKFNIRPKISKTLKTKYHLYVECTIYQHGIENGYVSISTGSSVERTDFKDGKVAGRTVASKLLNERLDDYLTKTKDLLNELSLKKVKTCGQLKQELESNLKITITGKPRRGSKNDFISKVKEYTYQNVMTRLFEDKGISEGRKRGYNRGFTLLNEFYKNDIPTIDQFSSDDLERFKKWILSKYTNQNTITDYLSKVAAVVKHAVKLKILNQNPLPENFRGSWKDGDRDRLSENDCLKIIALPDDELSKTEMVAKYCALVQMLTGVGYSDLKSFTHDNIKFNERENVWYIEKERNKTDVKFTVYLTENGYNCVNRLRTLTGNDTQPFNLPSIDYTNRMYQVIQQKTKIKTRFTTYTLRHFYAVHYMDNDGRLEDLQKMLGHNNIKTTQIYGKISDKRLSEKMKHLQQSSKIHQLQSSQQASLLKVV